jgi:hypothetical protein
MMDVRQHYTEGANTIPDELAAAVGSTSPEWGAGGNSWGLGGTASLAAATNGGGGGAGAAGDGSHAPQAGAAGKCIVEWWT